MWKKIICEKCKWYKRVFFFFFFFFFFCAAALLCLRGLFAGYFSLKQDATFVASCLRYMHQVPSEKGSTVKGKHLLPLGLNVFLFSFCSKPLFRRKQILSFDILIWICTPNWHKRRNWVSITYLMAFEITMLSTSLWKQLFSVFLIKMSIVVIRDCFYDLCAMFSTMVSDHAQIIAVKWFCIKY